MGARGHGGLGGRGLGVSRGRLGWLPRHHWGRPGVADVAIVLSAGGRRHGGHRGLVLGRAWVTDHGTVTIAIVREEMLGRRSSERRPTARVAGLASRTWGRPMIELRLSRVSGRPRPLSRSGLVVHLKVAHPHVDLLLLLSRHDARLLPLLCRQGLGSLDISSADSGEVKARHTPRVRDSGRGTRLDGARRLSLHWRGLATWVHGVTLDPHDRPLAAGVAP